MSDDFLRKAREVIDKDESKRLEDITDSTLSNASKPENFGKRMKIKCVVAGKDLAPFIIPKTFCLKCNKQAAPIKKCDFCQAYNNLKSRDSLTPVEEDNARIFSRREIKPSEHQDIIAKIVASSSDVVKKVLSEAFSTVTCPFLDIEIEDAQTVEDVNIIPEISFDNHDSEYVVRQALVCADDIKTNCIYNIYGTVIPSPKNQQAIHICDYVEQTTDNISGFVLDEETIRQLDKFRVAEGQSVAEKIKEIHNDISQNVTRIYDRFDLMLGLDLVWHSVLYFKFLGHPVTKGWLECLIIGDTRTGKSVSAQKLIEHYRMGELVSGENTSLAGLLAGLQQTNKRWTLMWGKIPLNDRRLLVVDEASGLTGEDFGKLSSVRSSGIAEITKIQMLKTFARTRLIWISNPRSRKVNEYNYGILSIKELFGKQEDIARLDFAITISIDEIGSDVINVRHVSDIKHQYTSELCNLGIRFAWSRVEDDISISKEVEDEVLRQAAIVSGKYSSAIPLVNSAEIRIKIIKMAVALAVRLFNYNTETKKVDVTIEHVRFVVGFLDYIYSKPSMGYDVFSDQRHKEATLDNTDFLEANIVHTYQFENLLDNSKFAIGDLQDIFDGDKTEVKKLLSTLVKIRAMKKAHSFYIKTPAFIEWLKKNKTTESKQEVTEQTLL